MFHNHDDSDGRLDSQINRIFTRISWKFFRLINVNSGRSLKFTPKSLDCLKERQTCWTILNSFFLITVRNNNLVHPSLEEREVCLPLAVLLLLHRRHLLRRNVRRIRWNPLQWDLIALLLKYSPFHVFLILAFQTSPSRSI